MKASVSSRAAWERESFKHRFGPHPTKGPRAGECYEYGCRLPDCVAIHDTKTARILAEWPKACGCGRTYVPLAFLTTKTQVWWDALRFAFVTEDKFCRLESRHCFCGSTIAVITKIFDFDEE